MKLILRAYELKLKHTFTISRKSITTQPTLIVELQQEGFSGYGEATSNPYYHITVDLMMTDIENIRTLIEAAKEETPEEFWLKISKYLKHNQFALCALDNAYADLYARKQGKKLYEFWNTSLGKNPLTDYTIGIDSIENMVLKLKEMPWPIYKIKLGTAQDLKIITELRKYTDSIFRVDANCAWTIEETINYSKQLKKLGVEFIEQPLKADDWDGHREVYQKSALPIVADESCISPEDIAKCHNHFHGVNIKLMKCGGVTPALKMIQEAKKLGLKTMVGCMTESTVGISIIAHLLPQLDYVDMDGALLLLQDIASGVNIKDGAISYSEGNGTGVILY